MEGISPQEAIDPLWIEKYEKQRDKIWHQLVDYNSSLFLLQRIESFPFELLLPDPDDRIFWNLTKIALWERCIMIAWRVGVDDGNNTLTLKSLKNSIDKNLQDEKTRKQYRKNLKQGDFSNRIRDFSEKVRHVRNKYLAHIDREANTNPDPQDVIDFSLSSQDLQITLEIMRDLFDVICFNIQHSLWIWAYLGHEKHKTDIDELLDNVARNSPVFKTLENEPDVFYEFELAGYTDKDIETLNQFRRKFQMPEIHRPPAP
ncbi:MAG: hypothetical protein K8J31_19090 [Anaerolineae bacterium]|nr:hypothetical protein [Anaerolineae bacterium]